MANISAADVKRLRDQTGAGMMDCKKALEASDGDFEKAAEFLRIKGQAGAEKRADRATVNGLVAAHVEDGVGTLVEINCETDFVAKGETFRAMAQQVLDQAVKIKAEDAATLLASEIEPGRSLQEVLAAATGTIGERVVVRRVARLEAPHVASYLHRTSPDLPPQIGVLVGLDSVNDMARDVAMHAAAMRPEYLTRDAVPAEVDYVVVEAKNGLSGRVPVYQNDGYVVYRTRTNSSTSARDGTEDWAPGRATEIAAAALAKRSAASIGLPSASATARPALKMSPAAVLSLASTGKHGE